jgi:hypothetical protein
MLDIDWIVCRGRERSVADGWILCPGGGESEEGRAIRMQDCLDCRHLTASPLDREPEGMCATETWSGRP